MDKSTRKAFAQDGAVLIKGCLKENQLARCRRAFDWGVEDPEPMDSNLFDGTERKTHNDNANPFAKARLDEIVSEVERRTDPTAYEIISWATRPGDVLVLHPGALHGGAAVDAEFPDCHTLVLRFFGDDAAFSPLPDYSASGVAPVGVLFLEELASLTNGAPFRASCFRQLV